MTSYAHRDELAMAWLNLSYVSSSLFSRQSKPILVSLNGRINFHTLTALMGPSGAGKTTLLKCINMKNREGLTSDTQIYVNKYTPLKTCFIMQDSSEHLFSGLTVRESLLFASRIKNCKPIKYRDSSAQTGTSLLTLDVDSTDVEVIQSETFYDSKGQFDHKRNVDRILSELLLQDCAGNTISACSGGEQKRLSIAQELVAELKPNLLCIDEPTSGLDSNASELVIQCLRALADRHPMSIVTSIHQPNSLLLNMFDQLYVLSKGGHCVFTGRPNQLRPYLSDNDVRCPEDVLPIELLLKISSKFPNKRVKSLINYLDSGEQDRDDNANAIEVQGDNEIDRLVQSCYKKCSAISAECKVSGRLVTTSVNQVHHGFNFHHFALLLHRGYTCFIRYQWKISALLLLFSVGVSAFIVHLFGTEVGEEDGCQDLNRTAQMSGNQSMQTMLRLLNPDSPLNMNLKCQFFFVIFLQFVTMTATILVFPQEVRVFLTEHQNRWYSSGSYFWSKCILDFPSILIISYAYSAILYFGTGQLAETARFVYFSLIAVIGMICSSSMGYFVGVAFAHNMQLAVTLGVAMIMVLTLVSGFFVPYSSLDVVLKAVSYSSYTKLTFECALVSIYGMDRCGHGSQQILLQQLKLDDNTLFANMWYLIGNIILWRLIALIGLVVRANDLSAAKLFGRKQKLKSILDNKPLALCCY